MTLITVVGVLEGPLAEITIGEVHLQIYTRAGSRNRFDPRRHGKLLREAADRRPANAPNPCLVPLDEEQEGGPYVYGHVSMKVAS